MQDPNLLKASRQKMLIKKERVGSSQSDFSQRALAMGQFRGKKK